MSALAFWQETTPAQASAFWRERTADDVLDELDRRLAVERLHAVASVQGERGYASALTDMLTWQRRVHRRGWRYTEVVWSQ